MTSPENDIGGIGTSSPRVEDVRFVQGLGRYTDDLRLADCAHLVVVRSPHAAARIVAVDTAAALAVPGVIAVLTGADLLADGLGTLRSIVSRQRPDGSPMVQPPYRILAAEAARFVGDAVAAVVAETALAARDGADLVAVEYEPGDSVTDVADAVLPGAPGVWPDEVPDNVAFLFRLGDADAVARAMAVAHHVARVDFRVTRVSANPIEPRNAIGSHDQSDGRYTLWCGTQKPHSVREELALLLGVPERQLRVVSPDVGGAFGMKGSPFPEYGLVLYAAKRIGRPVRWVADRSESFLSDFHARDNVSTAELALDAEGRFLALRVTTIANLGAYLGFNTPHSSTNNLGGLAGVYRTPAISAEVRGVHTHTQPTAPYRGAGRPEASYAIERIIDVAAAEMGIDRVALRRRNLIPPDAMPFKTGLVFTYDSGAFEEVMDKALAAADWAGFPDRRAASARTGKLRGIAVVNPIEIAGGPFRQPNEEGAEIRFDPGGDATLLLGTHSQGQGHETAFRQILLSLLGLDPARVRIVEGDTDLVVHGKGTFGSRSMMAGGAAVARAADRIVEQGSRLAAHLLEAAEGDVRFAEGRFFVDGTDRAVRIEEVAKASYMSARLGPGRDGGLAALAVITPEEATFPNGCHVCEVEIDPETGHVDVVSYLVVDDVGTMINPMLVKGQVHGGVAQGVGQALSETILYDAGQLVTGSFMDYGMPRATSLPPLGVIGHAVPTLKNPLGAKGAGEAGTVGALPAVLNAVVDALSVHGVTHLDMPASPQRVWQALRSARG